MARRLSIIVKELLEKSKQSALFAVEVYNKPNTPFRVQTFVMLMHVAWNSLLLAKFIKNGEKPYERDEKNPRIYKKVEGERHTWPLRACVEHNWKNNDPVRINLMFFIKLRNKVEHYRDQGMLTRWTFGESQSLVTNFEDFLAAEFGSEHSLADQLSLSIQLSQMKNAERDGFMGAFDVPDSAVG